MLRERSTIAFVSVWLFSLPAEAVRAEGKGDYGLPVNAILEIRYAAGDTDASGITAVGAGDMDGDGFGEVAVGAPGYENGSGLLEIHRGSTDGTETESALRAVGTQLPLFGGIRLGTALAAGDVNGDGRSDLLVGIPRGPTLSGSVGIVYGRTPGEPFRLETAPLRGPLVSVRLGAVIATGRLNGDVYTDVVVGAESFGATIDDHYFVYLGGENGLATESSGAIRRGFPFSIDYPMALALGDVSGRRSFDEIVINSNLVAPNLESVLVLYADLSFYRNASRARAQALAVADLNADGYGDVVAGSLYPLSPGVHVYDGEDLSSPNGNVTDDRPPTIQREPPVQEVGIDYDYSFGASVANAGDVNGDAVEDLIVGAPLEDVQGPDGTIVDRGRAYVYAGSQWGGLEASGFDGPKEAWIGDPPLALSRTVIHYGSSVDSAGDVNGDGLGDVVIAALSTGASPPVGYAFVHLGTRKLRPLDHPLWTTWGESQREYYGNGVAAAGDVNGDGLGDVLVASSCLSRDGFQDCGRPFVQLFLGSPTGLETEPAWRAEIDMPDARFGYSLCGAGDLNGDGYDDLAISAPYRTSGAGGRGRVYIWFGGPPAPGNLSGLGANGTEANDDRTLSPSGGDQFGFLVRSAGDIDGDDHDDLIVTDPSAFNATNERTGVVRVYSGHDLESRIVNRFGEEPGGFFGYSAATGDLNGDGSLELVVSRRLGLAVLDRSTGVWSELGFPRHQEFPVVGTADLNGDGLSDLIARPELAPRVAYVFYGRPTGELAGPDWEFFAPSNGGLSAGDLDDDGFDDLIIGDSRHNFSSLGQDPDGRVLVFRGRPEGLSDSPDRVIPPPEAIWARDFRSDWVSSLDPRIGFGGSLEISRDVNGDCLNDLVVGAAAFEIDAPSKGAPDRFVNQGAAFLYCGYGTPPDSDGDGTCDSIDNCGSVANSTQVDTDGDRLGDACDNCPAFSNYGQTDTDADGAGDGCDNCRLVSNPLQDDPDRDGLGDACDNCPLRANPDQADSESDGFPDACDNCPGLANPGQEDRDRDLVGDACDNCPERLNPDQSDNDADGVGDACEELNLPGAPQGFRANPGDARVTLRWDRSTEADHLGYRLERASGLGSSFTLLADLGAGMTSHVDVGLENGRSYAYRLLGLGLDGPGPFADPVTATPRAVSLALGFSGPMPAPGDPASREVGVDLTASASGGEDGRIEGWSLAVGSEVCAIAGATTEGTAGAAALGEGSGFERTEVTEAGVVSVVVLAFEPGRGLELSGAPQRLLRLTVERGGESCECGLRFADGLRGSGQPVDNLVAYRGQAFLPELAESRIDFCGGPSFRRGDSDGNGRLEVTDALRTLNRLFLGTGIFNCLEAADADDNGRLEITDPIRVLGFLFLGGPAPLPPGPRNCGPDPAGSPELGCQVYTSC